MKIREFFRFLFWIVAYSFFLFVAIWINNFFEINNFLVNLFFGGLLIAIGIRFLRSINLKDKYKLLLAIFFILAILFGSNFMLKSSVFSDSFPNSYKTNSSSSLFNKDTVEINPKTTKIVPSEMDEYVFQSAYKSCAGIETLAEANGVSNIKQKACREACGKRNMEYSSYDCEVDLLVCYCLV